MKIAKKNEKLMGLKFGESANKSVWQKKVHPEYV